MVTGIRLRILSLLSLGLLLLAVPKMGHAYVDPGSGAMIWQMAAAAVIGSLFYIKRILVWGRNHLGLRSERAAGFMFATIYAVASAPATMLLFAGHPLPRFNDIFLVGVVLTAYFFTWEPAAYLLVVSVLASAWVLPPTGSFRVEGFSEWYRLASFVVVAIFMICLVSRGKARRGARESSRSYAMHGAAAGAD